MFLCFDGKIYQHMTFKRSDVNALISKGKKFSIMEYNGYFFVYLCEGYNGYYSHISTILVNNSSMGCQKLPCRISWLTTLSDALQPQIYCKSLIIFCFIFILFWFLFVGFDLFVCWFFCLYWVITAFIYIYFWPNYKLYPQSLGYF